MGASCGIIAVSAAPPAAYGTTSLTGWQAVFVPKGTPRAVINRLNAEIKKIHAMPEVRDRILGMGFDPGTVGDPADVAAFVKAELIKWDKLIKSANLKAE